MKEVTVPGSYPAFNEPSQRWSVEMDEDQAIKELRARYYDSLEDIAEFTRGESRDSIRTIARYRAKQLHEENDG